MIAPAPVSDNVGTADNAEPPIGLCVDVVVENPGWHALGPVETWITEAAAALASTPRAGVIGDLTAAIALDTDRAVRDLNQRYRGLDKPTNVLSFRSTSHGHIGDIILALETVVAEAAELALPVSHHVQHLTVHGLLHLLGFDHETDADADQMESLETEILATLGIANPHADRHSNATN